MEACRVSIGLNKMGRYRGLTDREWSLLEECFRKQRVGRPRRWSDREIFDAILYILCEGIRWNSLPKEFPPCTTVYDRFRFWVKDGTLQRVFQKLRRKIPMGRLFYLDATQVSAKKGARRWQECESKRHENQPAV